MKYKIIKSIKHICLIGMLSMTSIIFVGRISNADTQESELKLLINQYKSESIVFEDGIVLLKGETLDLQTIEGWTLSREGIVCINEEGILNAVSKGTVYLSKEVNGKVHIIEIYVSDDEDKQIGAHSNKMTKSIYKVFIDPGHGGSDSGSLGYGNKESDINLKVSKKVENKLKLKNIDVQMSRNSDVYVGLERRSEMANSYNPDIFVSIHQNSAEASSANGIETYYHTNKTNDKPLSDNIQTNIIKETKATNRNVKNNNFSVLRLTNATASLVECGFISNEIESYNLSSEEYQNKLAEGIANGIEHYLKDNINIDLENQTIINSGVVTAASLNIRSGYGTEYSVIGTLSKGDKVSIIEEKNGWYKIIYNNRYGYISGSFVSIEEIFTDINGHWAKNEIIYFANKGYLNGYEDKTFKPNNFMRRDEFVKTVNSVFGFNKASHINFSDVDLNHWAYDNIAIAVNEGYINGYPNNLFGPSDFITRESAAKIISTILKLSGDGNLEFNDRSDIGEWAKVHVDALTDYGIIMGGDGNNFYPKKNMTRAEAVTMLSRAIDK